MADEPQEPRTPTGGLVAWVNQALNEGMSQRAAMRGARELELRFTDAAFRNLWYEQQESILQRGDVLGHPMDTAPPDELIQASDWGRQGVYYTWLRMESRIEGTNDILEQFFVVNTDQPVAPDEAITELMNRLADAETPNDTGKGLVMLGVEAWGFSWVPEE